MRPHGIVPLLLAFGLTLASLQAAAPRYLAKDAVDPIRLLPPPPAAGSAEAAADLETVYRVHHAATPAELALGKDETKLTIFHFAPAIGPWFVPGHFPKTEALFREIEAEAKTATDEGKKHWQRLRPYHADPARFVDSIEHKPATDYSYPSGHSTRGTLFAFILAELFPQDREALLAKGREIGWFRVVGGVHYPTDIYAGRVLGQALAQELLKNPEFQRDLAAAKEELAAAAVAR